MALGNILSQLARTVSNLREALPKNSRGHRAIAAGARKSSENSDKPMRIEIRLSDVVKITLTILVVYYLSNWVVEIRSVLVIFFLSIIIASALVPGVDWLEKKRFPRVLAAILVYILVLGILTLIISTFVPVVADQISSLAINLSNFFEQLVASDLSEVPLLGQFAPNLSEFLRQLSSDQLIAQIQTGLKALANSLYAIGSSGYFAIKTVFGGLFTAFSIFILSFYMVLEKHSVENSLMNVIPDRYLSKFTRLNQNIQSKMGAWLRGQLMVCIVIGVLTWIGLKIIGLPYAATLGLFTGIITIVPYLGVIISMILPLIIAFTISPWAALFVVIVYIAVQFLEGNFISPLIMSKAVDLNPVTVIMVLLIGGELFGLMGVVLAIPVTAAVSVFIDDGKKKL